MQRSYSHWPAASHTTGDDILLAEVSLRRAVDWAATPLVVNETDDATDLPLLVTQVQAVDRHACGRPVLQLDCRLDRLPFVWSQARLFSRSSRARSVLWLAVRRPSRVDIVVSEDVVALPLPADLRLGDLLAIPGRSRAAANAARAELS